MEKSAKNAVAEVLPSSSGTEGRIKKGAYHAYDEEVSAKIGRYAAENGNKAAVINESSVRNMKKANLKQL